MFAKTIIDSDAFLDMPLSTQALYFHLSMRADDDGFVNSPKKIAKMIGGSDDELKLLLAKRFILGFDSGIIVIKHWRIHNYIQKDRYKETVYTEEKSLLAVNDNHGYTMDTECIQIGDTGKDRIELGKDSIVEVRLLDAKRFQKPTIDELKAEIKAKNYNIDAEKFFAYYESNGWKVGRNAMKSWQMTLVTWNKSDFNKGKVNTHTNLSAKDYSTEGF